MTPIDNVQATRALLYGWLATRLEAAPLAWLDGQLDKISSGVRELDVAMAIGIAPRKLGKQLLQLTSAEIADARQLHRDFDASHWSVDQAGRVALLLASFTGDDTAFAVLFEAVLRSGELNEHIALLQGLPLYPAPQALVGRAVEGLRTAMLPVFEAVAHRNPFPRDQFSEQQWNQMVLKALFIESRLSPIVGLDERRNGDLAATLIDYAHERWAAGRAVSPELWRCVGPFARASDIPDLAKALSSSSDPEAKAAALALAESDQPSAAATLGKAPALAAAIKAGTLTWTNFT